ncbi:hypothetical protein WUBG_12193, partial [Wuchereria bancrofti]
MESNVLADVAENFKKIKQTSVNLFEIFVYEQLEQSLFNDSMFQTKTNKQLSS